MSEDEEDAMGLTRLFSTGAILSITTDIMCVREMNAIYDILNYLTQDNLFTHQLPRAARVARPWLVKQHPWALIPENDISGKNCLKLVQKFSKEHGSNHAVATMPDGVWAHQNPVEELARMIGVNAP